MKDDFYDRQTALWGAEGQQRIEAARVTIVGLGGLGSFVAQELAHLGAYKYGLIDGQKVDRTNLNRLIGATPEDISGGTLKVDVAARLIRSIRPKAEVERIPQSLVSPAAFSCIRAADVVFGCVDNDTVRFILMELCAAYKKPYLDIATDIDTQDGLVFGGRIAFSMGGDGCLHCWDLLDEEEVSLGLSNKAREEERRKIYGIDRRALELSGPSVVSLNGTVASLAVTEFMCFVTGIRPPRPRLTYYGQTAMLTKPKDTPSANCYYCKEVFGKAEGADVERYLKQDLPFLK